MTVVRPAASQRALRVRVVGLATVLAVCMLVIAMIVGGAAGESTPVGLPDAGRLTEWGLPISRLVADLAGVATVGLLLVPTLLLPARTPDLRVAAVDLVAATRWTAVAWAAAVVVEILLTVSDLLATPVTDLSLTEIQSFVFQISQGRALGIQAGLALVLALVSRWVVSAAEATFLLVVAIAALTPPVLTGHAASAGSHDLAVISLLVHIIAVSLWVGGLVGLLWAAAAGAKRGGYAITRFSTLAGWCIAVVAISGIVNAAVRLGAWSPLFTSGYGRLVLAKAACLIGLAAFGAAHRRRSVRRASESPDAPLQWGAFAQLAAAELALMSATIGIAVALSRTPTPVGDRLYTAPVEALLGAAAPARADTSLGCSSAGHRAASACWSSCSAARCTSPDSGRCGARAARGQSGVRCRGSSASRSSHGRPSVASASTRMCCSARTWSRTWRCRWSRRSSSSSQRR